MARFVTQVIERDIGSLKPHARNARTHSKKQVKQIASSIERFGFVNPVLIGDDGTIMAGSRLQGSWVLRPNRHLPFPILARPRSEPICSLITSLR